MHKPSPHILTGGREEILLGRPVCYRFIDEVCTEVPNDIYHDYKVGDRLVVWVASPGSGRVIYTITAKDDEGIWGVIDHDSRSTGEAF